MVTDCAQLHMSPVILQRLRGRWNITCGCRSCMWAGFWNAWKGMESNICIRNVDMCGGIYEYVNLSERFYRE